MNSLKELRVADFEKRTNIFDHLKGFNVPDKVYLLGYQLTGAQLFIKNFFNPNTLHKRLLINWQTGVGKSIAAISIGNEFIKYFQEHYLVKRKPQMVCVLGFNTSETIKSDMLKYSELGYVTESEIEELNILLINNDPRYVQYFATLSKRISDKNTGGYYKFYGYREFVNSLFIITNKGISNKITLHDIFATKEDPILLEEYISNNYITVNSELLNSLKNGIIICDEIHNVYNSLESNNYGSAIQYVLDVLKEDAPRAVFMSATPVTGNASEIIDLLNLLNENLKLKRNDYFYKDSDGIYQLKSNTLNDITRLTTGKVSFLLDTDTDLYPKRIFLGSEVPDIAYLKINVCELSNYHKNTIKQEKNLNYAFIIRALYDIVFPNPETEEYGMYNSLDVFNILQKTDKKWLSNNNIDMYVDNGMPIITGKFLHRNNINKYSSKYYNMLTDILDNITTSGKIMVFHYNVQLSGVILLQELFKENGFIDEESEPNNSTLCVICGISLGNHEVSNRIINKENNHIFKPCRFIMAHSSINKAVLKRNIARFNDITNLYGTEIKMIIGSRIIQEGLNFKAIQYQYIVTLPINYPILIQVLGRVVRKNSHIDLPLDKQVVYIKIYAHDIELNRYISKSNEYLVIQQVEKALRSNAVDNFINYKQINEDTLESLYFRPNNMNKDSITSKYFDAYNYNAEEIKIITKLLILLFKVRPVWTFDDILDAIKKSNINYNTDLIDKSNVELALYDMHNVNKRGLYYIYATDLDIECYYRNIHDNKMININLTQYYNKTSGSKLYDEIMLTYYEDYVNKNIELSLINLPKIFHIELLKRIILGHINDLKIIELYKRFKILIYKDNKPVGYIDDLAVNLYNNREKEWYNESYNQYNISRRQEENDILIGYVVNESNETKFKVRKPILNVKYNDLRTIRKGIVCENNIRENILKMIDSLRKYNEGTNSYAYEYDKSIHKGINIELCNILKLYLLSFEESSRSLHNGMKNGIRWVYLFHDILPNIVLK